MLTRETTIQFLSCVNSLKSSERPPNEEEIQNVILAQLTKLGFPIIRRGNLQPNDSCDLPQIFHRPGDRGFTVKYHRDEQSLLPMYILSAGIILSGHDFIASYRQKYVSISNMLSQCTTLSDFYSSIYNACKGDIE